MFLGVVVSNSVSPLLAFPNVGFYCRFCGGTISAIVFHFSVIINVWQ